ncbi:hypothetical protein [endosymbiont GvMRE of Glomus versiforme]|uniref:hypothetical protein n=1 Tax=endosymbiont GvMRE of Glomus versiforme TaxID=2039283 RepID=UPI000EBBAF16|nr:hypothetical protein [endosymbiont GvMRE of Glomus versiforme]RHZ37597.1 hypothetical protein GvMRE_I1g218 [endosymbiont GvMRE of Glomus versiforme]
MKLSQLQTLAKKVQLEIKSEEAEHLLASFLELEELLANFHKLKIKDKLPYYKTNLTLENLRQLAKSNYSTHIIKQETIRHNAVVSAENFLIIHRKNKNLNNVKTLIS